MGVRRGRPRRGGLAARADGCWIERLCLHYAREASQGEGDAARVDADRLAERGEDFGERAELVQSQGGEAVLEANQVRLEERDEFVVRRVRADGEGERCRMNERSALGERFPLSWSRGPGGRVAVAEQTESARRVVAESVHEYAAYRLELAGQGHGQSRVQPGLAPCPPGDSHAGRSCRAV